MIAARIKPESRYGLAILSGIHERRKTGDRRFNDVPARVIREFTEEERNDGYQNL